MDKLIFKVFFAFLMGGLTFANGQCLPNGITFTSQSQIDNFSSNYPGCIEVMGNLKIGEEISGNILNLNGLMQINKIAGDLIIAENTSLLNLQGLSNLNSLQGGLVLYSNTSLNSLSALENIETLGDGDGDGVGMYFSFNPYISSLESLSNLKSINGYLYIGNSSFTNLYGLENVKYIKGNIELESNFMLTDIEGIKNIDPSKINYLVIKQNIALSNCAIESVCNYLDIPHSINIEYNGIGCKSITDVEAACALGTNDQELSELKIYPNPTNDILNISGLSDGNIQIMDSQGRVVKEVVLDKDSCSISELTAGVYFIKITSNTASVTKQIIKI